MLGSEKKAEIALHETMSEWETWQGRQEQAKEGYFLLVRNTVKYNCFAGCFLQCWISMMKILLPFVFVNAPNEP